MSTTAGSPGASVDHHQACVAAYYQGLTQALKPYNLPHRDYRPNGRFLVVSRRNGQNAFIDFGSIREVLKEAEDDIQDGWEVLGVFDLELMKPLPFSVADRTIVFEEQLS